MLFLIFDKIDTLKILRNITLCCFISFLYANAQIPYTKHYTVENGLPSNTVYSTIEDHEGYLWFSTNVGVSKFDGYNFENFTVFDGLLDNEVISTKLDSDNNIWFLGYNGKLSLHKNDVFINQEQNQNFKINNLDAVNQDYDGKVYFVSYFNGYSNVYTRNKENNPTLQFSIKGSKKSMIFTENKRGFYLDQTNSLFSFIGRKSSLIYPV
ncbi:MAG: hypothetical protein HRT68_12610, partial [Flavobacteriaceae bacterium]|nr:hypothetical protein [Flavobacteriaceae bacterium]